MHWYCLTLNPCFRLPIDMDCHFSSIPATLISSFEPWRDHGNLDCNEWAGRWCPIKLAGNAAELGGGYTQFGHYNYFYDLLNYASPPN